MREIKTNDRDRLIKLLKQANTLYLDYLESIDQKGLIDTEGRAKFFADYLISNGIMVLPCKVGDLVYVIRRKEKRNKGGYWNSICFTKKVMQTAIKHGTAYIDCKRATKTDFSLIGKTVFLTREEAEKALERSKGNA